MGSKLQEEIQQSKPFESLQVELWLNLLRTAAVLGHAAEQNLRPFGLSPTQYNVLRILRGAPAEGLCQAEIGGRLVAQVPDVPRILHRMQKAGWVKRQRSQADRRLVQVSLTEDGRCLVDRLDGSMARPRQEMFHGMKVEEMQRLCELLELARTGQKQE